MSDESAFDETVPIRRGELAPGAPPRRPPSVLEPGRVVGVGQRVPVVYGARPIMPDVGQAPGADAPSEPSLAAVARARTREALPSLERREARLRTLTLVAYVTVAAVSALGLCAVALIAFA